MLFTRNRNGPSGDLQWTTGPWGGEYLGRHATEEPGADTLC